MSNDAFAFAGMLQGLPFVSDVVFSVIGMSIGNVDVAPTPPGACCVLAFAVMLPSLLYCLRCYVAFVVVLDHYQDQHQYCAHGAPLSLYRCSGRRRRRRRRRRFYHQVVLFGGGGVEVLGGVKVLGGGGVKVL